MLALACLLVLLAALPRAIMGYREPEGRPTHKKF
jgi:hypothetical protein